jgi:outer membrane protein OmpA-like peptidoglycan-associated protein
VKRVLLFATLLGLAGCAGAAQSTVVKISDAERTRAGVLGRDAQTLAPQAFAEADQALKQAKEADAAGDATAAELHAERAIAAYQKAIAIARLARATEEERSARAALERATEQAERYSTARKAAEREADDLDKQLKIAREAQLPAPSGTADPDREKARLVAAQALATQARLLCSAARLVSPQAPGLAEAEAAANDIEKKLEASPRPAPIDLAARARASCLASLTKARRSGPPAADQTDALLGEISKAADPKKAAIDLAPARDERGVVVTLRALFKGEKLAPEGEDALKDLGRVAAAHPTFALQVVVHDAQQPGAAEMAAGKKRGEQVASALVAGGAKADKIKVELAGARAPVVDPADAKRRDRNARIEVVFVLGT